MIEVLCSDWSVPQHADAESGDNEWYVNPEIGNMESGVSKCNLNRNILHTIVISIVRSIVIRLTKTY